MYRKFKTIALFFILSISFQAFCVISDEILEKEYSQLVFKYEQQPILGASPEERALTEMYDKVTVLKMVNNENFLSYLRFISKKSGEDFQELLRGLHEDE